MLCNIPIDILIKIINLSLNKLYLLKKSSKYYNAFIIKNKLKGTINSPKYFLFGGINSKDIIELDLEKKNLLKINKLPFIINDGTCIKKDDKIYLIGGNIDFIKFLLIS